MTINMMYSLYVTDADGYITLPCRSN